jgi:asparagine synthase (glutamine-hydrolysing)
MGGFTLILDKNMPDYRDFEERQFASMTSQGFAAPRKLVAGLSVLFVYPKQVTPTDNVRTFPDDDFIAVCGTFFYRGRTGTEGLDRIYRDFVPPASDSATLLADTMPEHMHGTYVCILFKAGGLYLFTDRIGLYKVYCSADEKVLSSSFLTVTACTASPRLNAQGVFEYIFQGATYGGETAIQGIRSLDPDSLITLSNGHRNDLRRSPLPRPAIDKGSLEEHCERIDGQLGDIFDECTRAFDGRIETALSGGYDSRLMLAHLLNRNVVPTVHVYGRDADDDVRIAKVIAACEGFPLSHVDKQSYRQDVPDNDLAGVVERNFRVFDGLPVDGIFDDGADLATRQDRARNGVLALNGGGGEIFRNFFYLPDRPLSTREIVWAFYSQFDSRCFVGSNGPQEYRDRLAEKIGDAVGVSGRRLTRAEVERIFPVFRCRYWMGKNSSINNRLGLMHTPLVEPILVVSAGSVPLSFKNSGRLAGALIARASPRLAQYTSAYGHSFDQDIPAVRRMSDWISTHRSPRVRRYMFPIKVRLRKGSLTEAKGRISQFENLVEHDNWQTPHLIRFDKVLNSSQVRRVLTLEYFCAQMRATA